MGAYHSKKNSEIFETGSNGTEISQEKFQKIQKLLNFRKANHSTEKFRKFRGENQTERKSKLAIFYSALVLLVAITTIIPFALENFRKFKPELFGRMESVRNLGGYASLDLTVSKSKRKSVRVSLQLARADLIIHPQREIEVLFSTLKNPPFPLAQSIKLHISALVRIPCLIPCHRCEKYAKESLNSHHLIAQRDNIHARAPDTCVDPRGYMTS